MSQSESPTRVLASFAVATRMEDVPARALEAAKITMLDTFGVALAAASMPIGRTISEHVRSLGGEPVATVVGAGFRTSAPQAALANGTLANALDFDEGLHLVTHTMPAALAIGEQLGLSGQRVLEAYVVGREVGARLMETIDARRGQGGGPTHRGWWHVGIVGPVASAVVVAKLLGLDALSTANAIGIATCSSAGLRRNMGTMAKALHSGYAASGGVHAALLAQRGFTGDPEILEAPLGLVQALCQPGEYDWEPILSLLGRPFELERPPSIKTFPSCTPSHRPIDGVLTVRREHEISPDEIESIEANLHYFSLLRTDPQTGLEGGFSGPYLLAVAMLDGQVSVDHLSDERINDPQVRSLMSRVRHVPELAPSEGPERVTVRLRDGRTLTAEIPGLRRLTTMEEIGAKFRDCAERSLRPEAVERLLTQTMQLEQLPDVAGLMASAAGSPSAA